MMLLSRFWYVFLSLLLAMALYVVFLAVGQYNRRNQVAMTEGLASDSQTVRWALQIDARRRLDALLPAAVDKGIQDSLNASNGKDKVLPKSRDDSRKSLDTFNSKLPAEYKYDSLFAVDRDGRVVAQLGFDQASPYEDFELGGYPAVYDALHGFLRDDTWVLGGRLYRVSARPVEYDVAQPPVGAVVGLKIVDNRFATEMSKLTRTNLLFFASGIRLAQGSGTETFDDKLLELVTAEVPKVEADKADSYKDSGRSGIRLLNQDEVGAVFSRFEGEAWEQRAGFAVARMRVSIPGPMGFLNGADDKDKESAPRLVLVLIAVVFALIGFGFSFLEHSLPLNEMKKQAARLKKGEIDLLQLARFRGLYRPIAGDINVGIERVAEKGGAPRKLADVDAIMGAVPAQPSMSAFAFPDASQSGGAPGLPGSIRPPSSASGSHPGLGGAPPPRPPGMHPAPGASGGFQTVEAPSRPGFPIEVASRPGLDRPPPPAPAAPPPGPPLVGGGRPPGAPPPPPAHKPPPPAPFPAAPSAVALGAGSGAMVASAGLPPRPVPPPTGPSMARPPAPVGGAVANAALASLPQPGARPGEEEEAATMVGSAPHEVMRAAVGNSNEESEWLGVYEDFIRTKKQCGEPTDGLTFEKFQHTLKKNRDALIQRHGCKRVRFSVYVKEGRASLKATPVKD
jgi:hypothetical protein